MSELYSTIAGVNARIRQLDSNDLDGFIKLSNYKIELLREAAITHDELDAMDSEVDMDDITEEDVSIYKIGLPVDSSYTSPPSASTDPHIENLINLLKGSLGDNIEVKFYSNEQG